MLAASSAAAANESSSASATASAGCFFCRASCTSIESGMSSSPSASTSPTTPPSPLSALKTMDSDTSFGGALPPAPRNCTPKFTAFAGVRELLLISYVELVSRTYVGHSRVCSFLRCLALETSWAPEEAYPGVQVHVN